MAEANSEKDKTNELDEDGIIDVVSHDESTQVRGIFSSELQLVSESGNIT